jgi:hypothetical protein
MTEIVYANLTLTKIVKAKEVEIEVKEVVYKHTDGFYHNKRILRSIGENEPLKVVKVEVIKKLGFTKE